MADLTVAFALSGLRKLPAATTFLDAPHRAGGCGDEVAVVFPAIFSAGRDPQPGFVEEGRGLEYAFSEGGMSGASGADPGELPFAGDGDFV